MTDIEKTLREKLAAVHHIVYYHAWDDLLATHLSARIPGTNHLLITPMNIPFEEVCASKLIKCDLDGNLVGDNGEKLLPQAINIHGEIYKKSDTIMSAMHTHSIYGIAVSSLEGGLLFNNQQALRFYGNVAYHDYDGLALENEGEEIVKSLKNNKVMILRNHGLLTIGKSIEEALYLLYYLEVVCELQIKTLSTGEKLVPISKASCQKSAEQFNSILTPEIEFETLTRRVEGLSAVDYRD